MLLNMVTETAETEKKPMTAEAGRIRAAILNDYKDEISTGLRNLKIKAKFVGITGHDDDPFPVPNVNESFEVRSAKAERISGVARMLKRLPAELGIRGDFGITRKYVVRTPDPKPADAPKDWKQTFTETHVLAKEAKTIENAYCRLGWTRK